MLMSDRDFFWAFAMLVLIGVAIGAAMFLGIPAAWPYIKSAILWLLNAQEVKP